MPTGLSTSNAVEIRNESGVCDSSALEKGTYRALQTVFLYLFKKKSSAHISPARKQRLRKLKYRNWVTEAEVQELGFGS